MRRSFLPRLDALEDRTVPSGMHAALYLDQAPAPAQHRNLGSPHALDSNSPTDNRAPDLSAFPKLQVEAGNKVAFHAYAEGVQIYRWNGTKWDFVAPEATLYTNAGAHAVVGTHYGGPTWESNSGSKVVGQVLERATADNTAIDWLLLKAKTSEGPGIFDRLTFIQRVNTVGGKAPTTPGTQVGEVARVFYTADYFFYRAHHGSVVALQSSMSSVLALDSDSTMMRQSGDIVTHPTGHDLTGTPKQDSTRINHPLGVTPGLNRGTILDIQIISDQKGDTLDGCVGDDIEIQ